MWDAQYSKILQRFKPECIKDIQEAPDKTLRQRRQELQTLSEANDKSQSILDEIKSLNRDLGMTCGSTDHPRNPLQTSHTPRGISGRLASRGQQKAASGSSGSKL